MPLLAQPAPVYTLIKAGINKVVADGLFLSAYPDVLTIEDYYRHLLNKTAEDLNLTAISTRLKTDTIFFEHISRIVSYIFSLQMSLSIMRHISPVFLSPFGAEILDQEDNLAQS